MDPRQQAIRALGRVDAVDRHELVGVLDGQAVEDHAVDDAEHARRQADAQAERHDRDERRPWPANEATEGELDFFQEIIRHLSFSIGCLSLISELARQRVPPDTRAGLEKVPQDPEPERPCFPSGSALRARPVELRQHLGSEAMPEPGRVEQQEQSEEGSAEHGSQTIS